MSFVKRVSILLSGKGLGESVQDGEFQTSDRILPSTSFHGHRLQVGACSVYREGAILSCLGESDAWRRQREGRG